MRSAILPLLLMMSLLIPLASCEVTVAVDEEVLDALTCDLDYSAEIDASYGAPSFDYLLEATGHLSARAAALEVSTMNACNAFATSIGAETGADAQSACANAQAQAEAILAANADASISAGYSPSLCSVEAEIGLSCAANCDANFNVETTPLVCEGGTMTGTCDGTCSGACRAEVEGACEGTCYGSCEGTCTLVNADGSCAGACDGECRGSCSVSVEASCEGTCAGSCDVTWVEPTCEGGTIEIESNVNCEAACEAESSFYVFCSEPMFEVSVSGTPSDSEQMDLLVAGMYDAMPAIISLREESEYVWAAAANVALALGEASAEALEIGLTASVCLADAVVAQVDAVESLEASVSASVAVEASVSASIN